MKKKPRIQPRTFVKPVSISFTPATLRRLERWMRANGYENRSEALRSIIEELLLPGEDEAAG